MSEAEKPATPEKKEIIRQTTECIIAQDGDTWIKAKEFVQRKYEVESIIETYDLRNFKVKKSALIEKSKFFKARFSRPFESFPNDAISVELDAFEVTLSALHDSETQHGLDKIDVAGLWLIISACDQYQIDHRRLSLWFKKWQSKNDDVENTYPALLFPCYAFNSEEAFLEVTKHLVFTSEGHIYERNPTKKSHLSTPVRIVQQLNGARGRVRTLLEKAIYAPIAELMDRRTGPGSKCRYRITFEYLQELRRLELFPSLELMATRTPLEDIFNKLEEFRYRPNTHSKDDLCGGCIWCVQNYGRKMQDAVAKYLQYFDGLCLGCIAKPKKYENPRDSEEYERNNTIRAWDMDCRVCHGEPTRYFSYHAREEKRRFGP